MIDEETIVKETETKEETGSPENPENTAISDTSKSDLDNDFEDFKKSKSEHTIEQPVESKEEKSNPDSLPASNLNDVEEFKLQIFLGLFFSLIDGIHVFLYKFVSKVEFDEDQLSLDETDREGLAVYFKTKRVLELINKLPPELIGLVHMEYLYYQRFKEIKKAQEKPERTMLHEEKEAPKKKAPAKKKKKPARKKPAKVSSQKSEKGQGNRHRWRPGSR